MTSVPSKGCHGNYLISAEDRYFFLSFLIKGPMLQKIAIFMKKYKRY